MVSPQLARVLAMVNLADAWKPCCRWCGADVLFELDDDHQPPRLRLGHPVPLCPEFAKAVEGGT